MNYSYAAPRPGFSPAAETLQRRLRELHERRLESARFSNLALDDQLIDAHREAANPGWDGEGSLAVAPETLTLAKRLVESLPRAYQTPEITPEPDGHVNLEWYRDRRRLLSVSVSPAGRLHWAALLGSEDPRGSCDFFDEAPKTLLHYLQRVCQR